MTGPFTGLDEAKRIEWAYNEVTQIVPFEVLATGQAWLAFRLEDGRVSMVNGIPEAFASLALAIKWQRLALTAKDCGFLQVGPTPTTTADMVRYLQICRRNRDSGLKPTERHGALVWSN